VDEAVDDNNYIEPASLSLAAYHGTGHISIYKSASKNAGPFSAGVSTTRRQYLQIATEKFSRRSKMSVPQYLCHNSV